MRKPLEARTETGRGGAREVLLGVERSLLGRRWESRTDDLRLALALTQRHGLSEIVARVAAAEVPGRVYIPNRLAEAGLDVIVVDHHATERPGAYHAGFLLGPWVNAGGRMGEARLLVSDDSAEAAGLAERLDGYNAERIEQQVLDEAPAWCSLPARAGIRASSASSPGGRASTCRPRPGGGRP